MPMKGSVRNRFKPQELDLLSDRVEERFFRLDVFEFGLNTERTIKATLSQFEENHVPVNHALGSRGHQHLRGGAAFEHTGIP